MIFPDETLDDSGSRTFSDSEDDSVMPLIQNPANADLILISNEGTYVYTHKVFVVFGYPPRFTGLNSPLDKTLQKFTTDLLDSSLQTDYTAQLEVSSTDSELEKAVINLYGINDFKNQFAHRVVEYKTGRHPELTKVGDQLRDIFFDATPDPVGAHRFILRLKIARNKRNLFGLE